MERFVFFEFIYFVLTYVLYLCITFVLYICMFPACCFRQRTCVAHGLLNGVLNETWTHSCFQYKWFLSGWICFYKGFCSSFLEYVYFGLLYPSLIFDMFLVVCVCVCVYVCVGFRFHYYIYIFSFTVRQLHCITTFLCGWTHEMLQAELKPNWHYISQISHPRVNIILSINEEFFTNIFLLIFYWLLEYSIHEKNYCIPAYMVANKFPTQVLNPLGLVKLIYIYIPKT